MTAKNDITGDKLTTKPASEAYRDNWDRIFGEKGAYQAEKDKLNDLAKKSCYPLKEGEKLVVYKMEDWDAK